MHFIVSPVLDKWPCPQQDKTWSPLHALLSLYTQHNLQRKLSTFCCCGTSTNAVSQYTVKQKEPSLFDIDFFCLRQYDRELAKEREITDKELEWKRGTSENIEEEPGVIGGTGRNNERKGEGGIVVWIEV